MRRWWEFSSGEWAGIVAILVLIIVLYVVGMTCVKHPKSSVDISIFEEEIRCFEAEQARLADSVERARNRNRNATYRFERPSFRRYATYKSDSFLSKPLVPREPKATYAIQKVELNRCDTSEIMNVPQFGIKRAQKIVDYRDRLGGFYSFHQIREIYILQNMDEAYLQKYFTIDATLIRKIAVNRSTYKEMIKHPYFDAYLVKTILNYRKKNGDVKTMEELRQITHAYPELTDKLTPYLSFE